MYHDDGVLEIEQLYVWVLFGYQIQLMVWVMKTVRKYAGRVVSTKTPYLLNGFRLTSFVSLSLQSFRMPAHFW